MACKRCKRDMRPLNFGQEMEVVQDWDGVESFRCRNQFCPAKFIDPVIKEMAEMLVETLDTVSRLRAEVLRLRLTIHINNQDPIK